MMDTGEKYTLKDVTASLTEEKRRADGTVTKFFLRPVSYPVSVLALNLGISPNAVTYFSALCCLVAVVFALTKIFSLHIAAAVLFLVFGILDCADGNMARTLGKKSVYGGAVDAAGGYTAYTTELFSMGLSAWFFTDKALWLLIGAAAAAANILMRLFYQAFKNAELSAGIQPVQGKEKRFSEEIGVTGYMPVLYLAGLLLPFLHTALIAVLPVIISVYALIYCGGFAVTTIKLVKKVSARDNGQDYDRNTEENQEN